MDLQKLQTQLTQAEGKLPPVERWDPDLCGDIDIHIKHDGSWHYLGTPIARPAMVRLFSTVLKYEDDNYFLVTPVEKLRIRVDDVPFLVTQWDEQDDHLVFTTQTEDRFIVNQQHPVTLQTDRVSGDLLPYVTVRRNLQARLHQNVFYQLVSRGEEVNINGTRVVQVKSGGHPVVLGEL